MSLGPQWAAGRSAFVKGMDPRLKCVPCPVLGFADGEVQEASGGTHHRGAGAPRE